jgi:hypothetical protein
MDAFNPTPPPWTKTAIHALKFCCPCCQASAQVAQQVWINRKAPVMDEANHRQWQEFYRCQCSQAWWAWSSDRPPSELFTREEPL